MILLLLCAVLGTVAPDTLLVPIEGGGDEAWEITTYQTSVRNTWRNNYNMCNSRGASLVEIYNEQMNQQVQSLVTKGGMWLGLVYATENSFMWTSGHPVNYRNWNSGQPDTSKGYYYTFIKSDGKWENIYPSASALPACMKKIKMNMLSENVEVASNNDQEILFDEGDISVGEKSAREYRPKIYLDGMVLHVGEAPTDWLNAYYFCKRKGLTLPTINAAHLNRVLTEQVKQLGNPVWLSLVGAGGRFWWMNGIPFDYNELAADYDIKGRDSTYTVLMEDGKWHDSCSNTNNCIDALPLCIEISPKATAEPPLVVLTTSAAEELVTTAAPAAEAKPTNKAPTTVPTEAAAPEYRVTDRLEIVTIGRLPPTTVPQKSADATQDRSDYVTVPSEPVPMTACRQAIVDAKEKERFSEGSYVYTPDCKSDGSFNPLQCGAMTCWCVDDDGMVIPKSKDTSRSLQIQHCLQFREVLSYGDVDKARVEMTECKQAIEDAKERERLSAGAYVYIPDCRSDGSFNPLQCGSMTCWCVNDGGMVIPNSIDTTRRLTLQHCMQFREAQSGDANRIDLGATTDKCMVESKTYSVGEKFRHGCNMCTCQGNDEFTCTPTTECLDEMVLCDYVDTFDYACSNCGCDEYYVTFRCQTYDRHCGKDIAEESNKIWFAEQGTQDTEITTAPIDYDNAAALTVPKTEVQAAVETKVETEPPVTEKMETEKAVTEKAATEKAATEKAATEKAATEKAATGKAATTESTVKVPTTEGVTEKQYKITLIISDQAEPSSWIDAYYDCQSKGMTLPTVMNDAINNYLQNYLRHHMIETWLDAEQYSGYAYWFSGTPMEYTKWAPYNEPKHQYGRAYVTLSYDGMWYTKQDYQKSSYYCMLMEEVTTKAVKLGYSGKCLIADKEYYKGETFGSSCNRCTCYLYSAVYVDCVKTPDCVKPTTPLPDPVKATTKPQVKPRVKSQCHGGVRYLDCAEPCKRECDSGECRRHCTEECSCPREMPVFYGGCCVEEAVCIDDGYESWFF